MYRNILSVTASLLLTVIAATGCNNNEHIGEGGGGGGGGGGGSSQMMAIASACAASAQARCDRLMACSPTVVQTRYGDEATCVSLQTDTCVGSLSAPDNGNDAAHTAACTQAIPSWACADYIDNTNQPTACQQLTGSVADGDPCVASGQCQNGFCAISPGQGCGSCAAQPMPDDECDDLTGCGPGLTCTSDTKQCEPFGASGAACGDGLPCGDGLACIGADAASETDGTCQPSLTTSGAACDPTLVTGPGCDRNAGLVCNTTSKTCATLVLAAAGAPCGSVNHQNQGCAAGTCIGSSGSTPGMCVANVGEGMACDSENGPNCLSGSRCVSADGSSAGTCQVTDATTCSMM